MGQTAREEWVGINHGPHHLSAVLHSSCKASRRLVIMAHGFGGNKIEHQRLFVIMARRLASMGINALRFDFMGSGESSGDFVDMTALTQIADLHAVIDWALARKYSAIGLLGFSFGGAISIIAAGKRSSGQIKALCTWSCVPSVRFWIARCARLRRSRPGCLGAGEKFYSALPASDAPEVYPKLRMPKLQVQGSRDLPRFHSVFRNIFLKAYPPKRHVIISEADHVFAKARHRNRLIDLTAHFFDLCTKESTLPSNQAPDR